MKKLLTVITMMFAILLTACGENRTSVVTESATTTSTTLEAEAQREAEEKAFGTLITLWGDAEKQIAFDAFEAERLRLEEEERQRQEAEAAAAAEAERQRVAVASQQQSYAANGSYLDCVRHRESRGDYGAVNGSSGAGGAYQFMPQTWNNTANYAGRPDLVGVHPSQASAADQDAMAQALYQWQGASPWAGPGC